MSYKSLYSDRQSEGTYLPRGWYIEQTERLSWVRNVSIKRNSELDGDKAKGFIVRKTVELHGGIPRFDYFIRVAENLSIEEQRFVVLKELMHCYFGPTPENLKYAIGTSIVFNTHFRHMFGDSAMSADSSHVQAEKMAVWMALGVLCPEHVQQAYMQKALEPNGLEEIAKEQIIPVKQAYNLTSSQYEDELANILN